MGFEVVIAPNSVVPVSPCCAQRAMSARAQLWAETAQPQAAVSRLSVIRSRIAPPRKARVGASQDFKELGLCGVVDEQTVNATMEAARGKRDEMGDVAREEMRDVGEAEA
jgi:hypothetical protein